MIEKTLLGLTCILVLCLVLIGIGCKLLPQRHARFVNLSPHDFPEVNQVRGVLIYDSADMSPQDLSLLVGDRMELERILGKRLSPRMTVSDTGAVKNISTLYSAVLSQAKQEAAADPKGIGLVIAVSAPARIVFVTSKEAYVREFATGDGEILETWMQSKELYQEFVKIGYLKDTGRSPSAR